MILDLHVQPGAKRDEVVGRHGDALKVRVSAPPEGGRANAAVLALLARTLSVPQRDLAIVAGAHTRRKRVEIPGLSPDEVSSRLGFLPL